MKLKAVDVQFSLCKVRDYSLVDLTHPYTFTAATEEENSLVCPTDAVPINVEVRDDGWRAFRIEGKLDFSLIGILAKIAAILAENKIGIFAISTYNTDYVLMRAENFRRGLAALADAGYEIEE
jgi:hypothetical protein